MSRPALEPERSWHVPGAPGDQGRPGAVGQVGEQGETKG